MASLLIFTSPIWYSLPMATRALLDSYIQPYITLSITFYICTDLLANV